MYRPLKYIDDASPFANDLAPMLRDTLVAMPKLTELHLNWREDDGESFMGLVESALDQNGSQLPSIKTLSIRSHAKATSVLKACSNAENLIVSMDKVYVNKLYTYKRWKKTLNLVAKSRTLQFVELDKGGQSWTTEQVDGT